MLTYALDNPEMIELLIDSGADVNLRAIDGKRPLKLAKIANNDEVLSFLKLLVPGNSG